MKTSSSVTFTDCSELLNAILQDYFSKSLHKAQTISPYYGQLWEELSRLAGVGGKKLRPKMSLLAYQALGGNDLQAVLPVAASLELLHVGVLIHDDIIDRDYMRYGVDNIAGGYKKLYEPIIKNDAERLHFAHSAAILAGDLLISGAYQLTLESTLEPSMVLEVQRLLSKSVFEVVGGELIDTESAFRELGDIKAETVAIYKTASYSFIAPLLIGAVMAQASAEDQAYLRLFAENLGVAFQLRDDVIGVFGDEVQTGKSTTGDIREGKRTFMVEQFYQFASDEDKKSFEKYFGNQNVTSDEVDIVKGLLVSSGALAGTEEAIARYEVKAHSALDSLGLEAEYAEQFKKLIIKATRRDK
jgi:geranylgeranyl diphosphate synthase type II